MIDAVITSVKSKVLLAMKPMVACVEAKIDTQALGLWVCKTGTFPLSVIKDSVERKTDPMKIVS